LITSALPFHREESIGAPLSRAGRVKWGASPRSPLGVGEAEAVGAAVGLAVANRGAGVRVPGVAVGENAAPSLGRRFRYRTTPAITATNTPDIFRMRSIW